MSTRDHSAVKPKQISGTAERPATPAGKRDRLPPPGAADVNRSPSPLLATFDAGLKHQRTPSGSADRPAIRVDGDDTNPSPRGIGLAVASPSSVFALLDDAAKREALTLKPLSPSLLSTAMLRRIPSARMVSLAATEGDSPDRRSARSEVAIWFMQSQAKMPAEEIVSHLSGIDVSRPVMAKSLSASEDTLVRQFGFPGGKPGQYFTANDLAPAEFLGVRPVVRARSGELQRREGRSYAVIAEIPALESTAAPIRDTWSTPDDPRLVCGGAVQLMIPKAYHPRLAPQVDLCGADQAGTHDKPLPREEVIATPRKAAVNPSPASKSSSPSPT